MNHCIECGYKIDGNFKFCPNCGTQLDKVTQGSDANSSVKKEVIICKNCGEENSPKNVNCFSCGVQLKGGKKETISSKMIKSDTDGKQRDVQKKYLNEQSLDKEEKVLDSKKILSISAIVIVVFILALVFTGVFDSGIQKDIAQVNDQVQTDGNQVNLAKLDEINELENKIKENPDDLESTLHLAHLSQDSGLLDKAISNYKKYLEKNPENADARVDMGICYYNLGDYAAAINEMETAIKYESKHQIAHLNLGIVNLTAQNLDVSKEWFRKAMELDPDSEAGKRAQELLNSH